MAEQGRVHRAYVLDLDGTVYVDDALLPGAADAIAALRATGSRIAFLTNKPLELPAEYAAKLERLGVPCEACDVVSSTDALVLYLGEQAAGARLFVVGEPVVIDLLRDAGFEITDVPESVDVVVVSFDRTFDYAKLLTAFRAIRGGARLVATNPDPYCPTGDGGLPDCGAILAAIETAAGVRAEAVVGKPSSYMAHTILSRLGLAPADVALVGDRLLTDVQMAQDAGMTSVLVLSGATTREDLELASLRPDVVIDGIADLHRMVRDGPTDRAAEAAAGQP
jgi:HAD superfamily hydrolase (TIGR01450 family)